MTVTGVTRSSMSDQNPENFSMSDEAVRIAAVQARAKQLVETARKLAASQASEKSIALLEKIVRIVDRPAAPQ